MSARRQKTSSATAQMKLGPTLRRIFARQSMTFRTLGTNGLRCPVASTIIVIAAKVAATPQKNFASYTRCYR